MANGAAKVASTRGGDQDTIRNVGIGGYKKKGDKKQSQTVEISRVWNEGSWRLEAGSALIGRDGRPPHRGDQRFSTGFHPPGTAHLFRREIVAAKEHVYACQGSGLDSMALFAANQPNFVRKNQVCCDRVALPG